jgi:hypothetical protein
MKFFIEIKGHFANVLFKITDEFITVTLDCHQWYNCIINFDLPSQWYPYLDEGIGWVRGLAWSNGRESYASGSLLLVGTPMLDMLKVMALTKWGTLVLQVGGWA